MIAYMRSVLAGFVSKEVKAAQNRYNKKCLECRSITDSMNRVQRESELVEDEYGRLKARIKELEKQCEQYDLTIESLENKMMLTEQVVTQQQHMIHRDIELRKLEHITASAQVGLARSQTGFKEESNAPNESDVNYRPGR